MPQIDRSGRRNVHIYDSGDPTAVLGGLILTNRVTNANFYSMIEVLFVFTAAFFLRDEGNTKREKDDHPLQPEKHFIVAGSHSFPWLVRTISNALTGRRVKITRTEAFCDAVRSHDRRCVVSGIEVLAAYIFPLAWEGYWNDDNYGRWITIPPADLAKGSINSVQNGLLLYFTIHQVFDSYHFPVNPDDNYKIVFFSFDLRGLSGKHLDQSPSQYEGCWESIFEHDFPSGSDIVGDILHGPKAAERMEYELFSRLGAQVELFPTAGGDGDSV
ncbi:hypothetical protein K469DRAFT_726814 [Zopfia rhizophila CBS 207.26]|uniref:Uncharacterized protein n=1 Tax=Zopfia rhizophila CBS 207.26 TaxID=1314779 RepID=A0A6A6E0C3_9PEZI|nr:hypothetical protein K469DRAFT_726814 [Zopfia rhizophila CBS 207.26]